VKISWFDDLMVTWCIPNAPRQTLKLNGPSSRDDEKNFRWSDGAVLAWFGAVIDPLSSDLVLLSTATGTVSHCRCCPYLLQVAVSPSCDLAFDLKERLEMARLTRKRGEMSKWEQRLGPGGGLEFCRPGPSGCEIGVWQPRTKPHWYICLGVAIVLRAPGDTARYPDALEAMAAADALAAKGAFGLPLRGVELGLSWERLIHDPPG
jgi:hypothetical protein